jgi:hypothetical protein
MKRACQGIDSVIHLGGHAGEATWEIISHANIEGTFTVFEAARSQKVNRVVFASSNHAVGFYPHEKAPAADYLFPMPDTYYGVSKIAGEALGSLYHHRYGLDVICVRILTCTERPLDLRSLSTWLSPADAGRLFEASLSIPSPGFRVVWGVSANTRGWFSLAEGESIGYMPQDNAEQFAVELADRFGALETSGVEHDFLGGSYCSHEFDTDTLTATAQHKARLNTTSLRSCARWLRKCFVHGLRIFHKVLKWPRDHRNNAGRP